MKKIFTILFSVTIVSSAFAQSDFRSQINIASNNNYRDDPRNERDREVNKINYVNHIQVQQVVDNCFLNIWEKRDALDALEFQRIQKVNDIYQKYSNSVAYFTAKEMNNSFDNLQR